MYTINVQTDLTLCMQSDYNKHTLCFTLGIHQTYMTRTQTTCPNLEQQFADHT